MIFGPTGEKFSLQYRKFIIPRFVLYSRFTWAFRVKADLHDTIFNTILSPGHEAAIKLCV